jgi:hypothetical protein
MMDDGRRMRDEPGKFGMPCSEFAELLADAMDGALSPPELERFEAHRAACPLCPPLFDQAQAGLNWLGLLKAEEAEPPADMLRNIVRQTVGSLHPVPAGQGKAWMERLRQHPMVGPVLASVLQPRFAMSFGMAFFSITLLLNVFGIRLAGLKQLDLSPNGVMHAYGEASGRVLKYYQNIRLVYEIESSMRELKRATTPEAKPEPSKQENTDKPRSRETSEWPRRQDQAGDPTARGVLISRQEPASWNRRLL